MYHLWLKMSILSRLPAYFASAQFSPLWTSATSGTERLIASSIAVSRKGAADSIPTAEEVSQAESPDASV